MMHSTYPGAIGFAFHPSTIVPTYGAGGVNIPQGRRGRQGAQRRIIFGHGFHFVEHADYADEYETLKIV